MKRILIVGGGVNQVPLVLASKREGYYVVVVDYAGMSCPAFALADRFYKVSTRDEEAILEVAKKERIDGIISNSEASMLIVNSIAEKLNLVGNPTVGVEYLVQKSKFRDLQNKAGLYAPQFAEVTTEEDAISVAERWNRPFIVKPCESSGSRGCKVLERFEYNDVLTAYQSCRYFSRNEKVIIEEYVTMPSLQTIEGDIFVFGETIIWDGLFYTTRASWAPMVPMTYTAPMLIHKEQLDLIKSAVLRVFNATGIRFGEFNIEGYFTETGEFFIIEVNARQGGNFLPRFLRNFTGIDYNRFLVTTCVNDDSYYNSIMTSERQCKFVILHSVYSQEEGYYLGVDVDDSIKDKVTKVTELLSVGDKVERCIDGTSIVASVELEFDTMEELYYFSPKIMDGIHVRLSNRIAQKH